MFRVRNYPKKQLKRLREESISLDLANTTASTEEVSQKGEKKNKKDRQRQEDDLEEEPAENLNGVIQDVEDLNVESDVVSSGPFNWHKAIKCALKAEDDKCLSVKKLRKKVIAEFMSTGGASKIKAENEIYALFEKKLHSYQKVKILKDKVTLVA